MSSLAYPAYKESGVEWIGAVPHGWEITRLSQIATVINGYPFDAAQFDTSNGTPLVRIRDLNASATEANYCGEIVEAAVITSADVLIGMDGDFNVGRWKGEGVALLNQRMCCLRGANDLIRLLEYALPYPLRLINDVTYSTTVKHLSSGQVRNIRVAFPPTQEERQAIISFLDSETSKIDALVAEQERLMVLLKEKRQAVISHAVTEGLDPNVPMKASAVEWLGNVPAAWNVKRLKYIAAGVTVGVVVMPSQYYAEEGIPALRSLNVREMAISMDDVVYFDRASNEMLSKSMLHTDDLVVVRTGKPGTTAVIGPELDGANCIDLILIRRSPHFVSRFVAYVMNSEVCRVQYEAGAEGAIQQHFNIETAGNLRMPVPPLDEQEAIVAFLDAKIGTLDALTAEAERAINLLGERRAALISAAVTGKIDVRGLVPDVRDAA